MIHNHLTLFLLTSLLVVFAVGFMASEETQLTTTIDRSAPETTSLRPRIEVVFVLDTTGSMGNMIAGAKSKIWSIVNTMATAQPVPEIHMGLVAYRDRGDHYITLNSDLSEDLDATYATLMKLVADGGGDGPESVNQALNEAVTQMSWSSDESAYRVIFLVGDCPPHMDYKEDIKYQASCLAATGKGIIINTILCGNDQITKKIWEEIARLGEGDFAQVEQSGGTVETPTPYDDELVNLSQALDDTRLYYGSINDIEATHKRKENADLQYESNSLASNASRASFQVTEAGKYNFLGENELVSAIVDHKVDLKAILAAELPEELQGKSYEEQMEIIESYAKKRDVLGEQVNDLSGKRIKWLRNANEMNDKVKDGFDAKMADAIIQQAAEKGLDMKTE